MKLLVKKYPKLLGVLEWLQGVGNVAMGDLYGLIGDKALVKSTIMPKLLQQGILRRHNNLIKVDADVLVQTLRSLGKKVSTVDDIKTVAEFCKMPHADEVIKSFVMTGAVLRVSTVASAMQISKSDANKLILMLVSRGVLTPYRSGFKADNLDELCRITGIDSNDAGIDSHSKSIISWEHFEYQPHLIQAIISVTTIGPNGREPETVKAVQLATTLGVSKKEFVTRYAPTLVQRGLLAQVGNAYTKGPRIREYIEELTKIRQDTARERRKLIKDAGEELDDNDEMDERYEKIQHILATGDERRAERLKKETPAQRKERERRRAKLVASSVAKMEKRRAVELKDASDWHKSKMLTSGEYKQRTKDINDQYDEMIKNLKGE